MNPEESILREMERHQLARVEAESDPEKKRQLAVRLRWIYRELEKYKQRY